MPFTFRPGGAALALGLALASCEPAAQEARRTVWSGVFTEAQAARGQAGFDLHCEACHGRDLGGGEGPTLLGSDFMRNWTGLTVRELFHHVRVAMPEYAVSSVSEAEKLDILTYIFTRNGFPSGSRELTTNAEDLAGIAFEGRNGPEPPPTGATVRAVGCLAPRAAGDWQLQRATEPVRTTLEIERDRKPEMNSREVALGEQTIRLMSVPSATGHKGQKVVVLGLMVREQGEPSINVLELSGLGSDCAP